MHDATLATATGTAVLTLGLSAYAALIFIGIAVAGYRSWRATLTRENAMSDR